MRVRVAAFAALLASCGAPEIAPEGPGTEPTAVTEAPVRSGMQSGAQASGAQPMVAEPRKPLAVSRAQLDRVLTAGPGRLLQQVPVEPSFAPGHKFVGFRLLSLWQDDPQVARFGVQAGDVLVSVNGVRIVRPDDLLAVFTKLKTAVVLQVQVFRGGNLLTFECPIVAP